MYIRSVVSAAAVMAGMLVSQAAFAQANSEVVVMRRSLDPKTRTYSWVPGEWSQCSNSCGAGQQTRSVQCLMNGKHGSPEVNCGPNRPEDTQSCYDVQACSYSWRPSEWTDVEGCGQVVETRTLSCLRSDGRTVSNDQCPQPEPDTAREVRDLRTCSYSWKAENWGAWSDYCRTGAERSRDVYCLRSNGERAEDSFCSTEGPKPDDKEAGDRYEQCGYSWQEKPWGAWSSTCQTGAKRDREVVCLRSNGDEVPDVMCGGSAQKPATSEAGDRYEGCSYSWRSGEWGAVIPACGTSSRSRTVECVRSNGDVVNGASCDAASKPAETEAAINYDTCTYDWTSGDWSAPSNTCGSATSTRSVTCLSSDGRTVADSFCSTAKPDTSKSTYETSSCSYSWRNGEWGAPTAACGASTQYRSVWCLRSDGQTVADGSCAAGSRPADSQSATDYSTCTYEWKPGAWSAPSNTCGQASYTRPVTCVSSDGRNVADSYCSGQKPDTTKSDYVTTGCSYGWNASPTWSAPVPACGPTVQNRSVTCLRSDGTTVADGLCSPGTRPASQQAATDYSTCTYGWTATSWGAWSTACGQATQGRSVTCQSSDGRTVADSFCSAGSKPAASQSAYQTSGCGYTWQTGAFGSPTAACGASAQYRDVWCLRSDGQRVGDEFCGSGKPSGQQAATDYSTCSYSWSAGGWTNPSTMCGAATQTRSVTCLRSDGTTVADASCASAGARPATTQASYQTVGCSHEWVAGAWGASDRACSAAAIQTRSVTCRRSDGQTVGDAECTGAKPAASQTVADYSACSNYWVALTGFTDWSSHCSANASRTRTVSCIRNEWHCDPNSANLVSYHPGASTDCARAIPDSSCAGQAMPARSETSAIYDGCGYTWQTGEWGAPTAACGASTQYRSVWCRRSDGTTVDGSLCGAGQPASAQGTTDYSACSYGWAASGWDAWSTGCGQATQSRSVWCQRSDGTAVGDASCGGGKPVSSQSGYQTYACGYSWQAGGWGAPTAACGASTQYRAVWCQRSDGATVDGSLCGGGQPASAQGTTDYSACSYGWAYNGWGTVSQTCGNITQTRSVWCQRSDGASVADGYCGGGKPGASQSWADYSACTYSAVNPGGWSGWNSTCSANAYRSRHYQCRRADGAIVGDAECTNRGIGLDEGQSAAVYDGCSYAVTGWSGWSYASSCSTNTTATQTATGCRRSDGTMVGLAECSNRGVATTQSTQTSNLAGCGYSWQAGGWSAQQAVCTSGTQTRDVWCQRTDGARVDGSLCGWAGQPASSQGYSNTAGCSYAPIYGDWSACPMGPEKSQSRTVTCTRLQTGESVDTAYCGLPSTQSQPCDYNPGGTPSGTVLGTYAFATCSGQYDYGTMGTMPGINPAQCRTGVATYARKCSNGGNIASNANCNFMDWQTRPIGPSGYPCDLICR